MHNFQSNYDKILDVLKGLGTKSDYLRQIRKPKLSDLELIAIDLTSEYMSIDIECQLFRTLPTKLSNKIERSVYNRRRRKLFSFREELRKKMTFKLNKYEDFFIVDSMPLEVCKLSRSSKKSYL